MKKTALAILLASMAMPSFASVDTTAFSGEVLFGYANHDASGSPFSDSVFSYGIRGGYQVNENFAIEASYQELGEAEDSNGVNTLKMDASALMLGVKGIYPLQNGFSVVGRLGLSSLTLDLSDSTGSISDDGTELYFGIGAQYDINEQFYVGAEYTFVSADIDPIDYDIDNFTLSAGMRF